jgi:hypothetical protein
MMQHNLGAVIETACQQHISIQFKYIEALADNIVDLRLRSIQVHDVYLYGERKRGEREHQVYLHEQRSSKG